MVTNIPLPMIPHKGKESMITNEEPRQQEKRNNVIYPTNAVEFVINELEKESLLTVNQIAQRIPYTVRTVTGALKTLRESGKVKSTKKLSNDLRSNYYYLIRDKEKKT